MGQTLHVEMLPNYVKSLRANTRLNLGQALAELIDNSLDALSKTVAIEFDQNSNSITISDDGVGCDDMRRFIQLGASQEMHEDAARVGRYGVGSKLASAKLAYEQIITSVFDGIERGVSVPWGEMENANSMACIEAKPRPVSSANGTVVQLLGITKQPGNARYFAPYLRANSIRYWQKIYLPSLRSKGTRITVNGEALKAIPFPKLIDSRKLDGEFEGKRYEGIVGILGDYDTEVWDAGWYVGCAGRLMNDKPLQDCFDRWPGSQVWGYFELLESRKSEQWALDTNKLDFAEREPFFEMIVSQIEDLMRKGEEQGRSVETGILEEQHSAALAAMMGGTKHIREKRNSAQNTTGTVIPIDSGKKREQAEKVHPDKPGSVNESGDDRTSIWRFMFSPMGGREICKATLQKKTRWVRFDSDNLFVAHHWRNTATLMAIAAFAFWDEATERQQYELWTSTMNADEWVLSEGNLNSVRLKWVARALGNYAQYSESKKRA